MGSSNFIKELLFIALMIAITVVPLGFLIVSVIFLKNWMAARDGPEPEEDATEGGGEG